MPTKQSGTCIPFLAYSMDQGHGSGGPIRHVPPGCERSQPTCQSGADATQPVHAMLRRLASDLRDATAPCCTFQYVHARRTICEVLRCVEMWLVARPERKRGGRSGSDGYSFGRSLPPGALN